MQEPEFEDVATLRNIFNTLEDEVSSFKGFLENSLADDVKVFIGDEIGLSAINNCSLVLSSLGRLRQGRAYLGLLGPVRMNYPLAISSLNSVKALLDDFFGEASD